MRELLFLGTWDDSWRILESILADSAFSFSPDRWYPKPRADVLTELTPELKGFLQDKRHLYIWSPSYTKAAPHLRRQSRGEKAGAYAIMITMGGPGLELTLPACFQRGNRTFLNYGSLAHPRMIEDPETGEWRKPSAELIAGFKEVSRRMTSDLVREKDEWIGKDALRLLRSGEAERWAQAKKRSSSAIH